MEPRIRVLLADDTLIAREGWKKILETEEGIEVIGEAITAQEVPQKVRELQPDVLLMDLKWFEDESAGAAAIAKVNQVSHQTKVVAITVYPHLIADARKVGCEAALPKGFSKVELVGTIRAVSNLDGFSIVGGYGSSEPVKDRLLVNHISPVYLAAAIGVPLLGLVVIAIVFMIGIRYLTIEQFLTVIIFALIAYFWVIVFAGRYVDIISETTMYRLFVSILHIFSARLPRAYLNHKKEGANGREDQSSGR